MAIVPHPLDGKIVNIIREVLNDPHLTKDGFVLRCAREAYLVGKKEGLNTGIVLADAVATSTGLEDERNAAVRIADAIIELHPDAEAMKTTREIINDGKR